MERLLTTRDMQHLLQVDRITVYRMLDSRELPGIKVGGQWRFPETAVGRWLEGIKAQRALSGNSGDLTVEGTQTPHEEQVDHAPAITDLVGAAYLQNIQDSFAEAVGVASLVIDLEGSPLTAISNGCAFCHLGRISEDFRRCCSESWAALAHSDEDHPQVHLCHAGVGYALAPVQVHGIRLGLVVGGQFWPERPEDGEIQARSERLAAKFNLPADDLFESLGNVPVFSEERVFLMTKLLATIADALSEIGFQAYEVRKKLQQIAQIAKSL